jgi:hypothetical protein
MNGFLRVRDVIKAQLNSTIETIAQSSFHDYSPVYAEDSGSVAFISSRSGDYQVWLLDSEGNLSQLTEQNVGDISYLTISSDGRYVAYSVGTQVTIIDSQGNVLFQTPEDVIYNNPTFTEDSKTLFYSINHEGKWFIEKRMMNDIQSPIAITEGYIAIPCHLNCFYFIKYGESELRKYENGLITKLDIKIPNVLSKRHIDITNHIIHYSSRENNQIYLRQYDMNLNTDKLVTRLPNMNFSFDKKNKAIYSYKTREQDTRLELINLK